MELIAALNGHEDEKKAKRIASKLGGSDFDVYRSLPTDDKKDPEKNTTELLQEYSREECNREVALHSLVSLSIYLTNPRNAYFTDYYT